MKTIFSKTNCFDFESTLKIFKSQSVSGATRVKGLKPPKPSHLENLTSKSEVESSRTSLALRTHFEVLGLGLEASKSSKMPCPRPRTALFFDWLKMGQGHDLFCSSSEISRKNCDFLREDLFFSENARNFAENLRFLREDLFFIFHFWRTLIVRCVLGP